MKQSPRLELTIFVLLLVAAMGIYCWMQFGPPKLKSSKPQTAIQDGKTIDFSPGVAVIKDDAKNRAALEKSLKEMDAAVKDVSFAPTPTAQKKPEPAAVPAKK